MRGIEEDIDKTITDVPRENCAGDDGGKILLMATAWRRQCLVNS